MITMPVGPNLEYSPRTFLEARSAARYRFRTLGRAAACLLRVKTEPSSSLVSSMIGFGRRPYSAVAVSAFRLRTVSTSCSRYSRLELTHASISTWRRLDLLGVRLRFRQSRSARGRTEQELQ